MATWTVEHYEHEFTAIVVGDPEIEENGALINTVAPENLHFVWQLAELGPSEIDYEVSLTATDTITDDPVVSLDFVRPYFQDFALYRDAQLLMGGMITGLNIEAGGECVKIAGKDWLHYLERRMWPYDATLSYVNWPTGFRFKVTAAEIGQIVTDVIETVRDVSGNYPGPPNDLTFPSYSLKFVVDCDDTTVNRNYEISAFETSNVYDLVRSLSQMDKDDGGFDFYMTPDRPPATTFRLVYPEIGNPAVPIYTLEIDEPTAFANMLELGYTDSGPEASHVLGVGAGQATRAGGVNKHLRIVSARTRRLDKSGDFGDVKNLGTLESKTLAELNRAWRSIHEIPILVDPATIPNFWTVTQPGEYIMVDYDLFGHHVNSVQKIVSMDVTVDLEGNERVLFGLNQQVDGGATSVASDP